MVFNWRDATLGRLGVSNGYAVRSPAIMADVAESVAVGVRSLERGERIFPLTKPESLTRSILVLKNNLSAIKEPLAVAPA